MKEIIHAVKAPVHAQVCIPGSKSITNRALLLAAMAEGVSELSGILFSADTLAFMKALTNLGVEVAVDSKTRSCAITGCAGQFPNKEASIWCEDAGTVARFLLAACAASSGNFYFEGSKKLNERPLADLLRALASQGARVFPENAKQMPLTVTGADGFSGGVIDIEGYQTSQFISALLMAAPFANHEVIINTRDVVSNSYVEMTCDMMADFGVQVRRMHAERFSVPAPQRYTGRHYVIEPDLSTASYFFAAAAVTGGSITIQTVDRAASKQGDIAFLTVLEKMGCHVEDTTAGLKVEGPSALQGVSVDMMDFSDTFMTLAALAPFANSPTTITNIGHTRLQESNRISAMCEGLQALGVKVEEGQDRLTIFPGAVHPGVIASHHDHRIAMAFSIIGLKIPGIEIDGAECVVKTCPEFFTLWRQLH